MRIHCKSDNIQNSVLVDTGTSLRIPFGIWFDSETGEYEAFQATPDGFNFASNDGVHPIRYRGKAKGKLKLVSGGVPLRKVKEPKIDKEAGLQIYKEVFCQVWQYRGEAKKVVNDRWSEYLMKNEFLDHYIIKRKA